MSTSAYGTAGSTERASFWKATLAMIVLSVALFWLPILGPVIAGLVGGYLAGTAGRAFLAALMPAVVLGLLIGLIGTAFELGVLGAVAGGVAFVYVLVGDILLIVSALVAAAVSSRR